MLYQLHIHVTQGLKVIYEASHLGMGGASASSCPLIDVGSQGNMMRLKEPPDGYHHPEFIKQGTEECFALRKQPRVTGSSLGNAIGLRTLKNQKLHFYVHVSDQPMTQFSPEVLEQMAAGVEGEPHAAATLATGFLPVFFPSSNLVEDGARFIRTYVGTAIEVSTDRFLLSGSQVSISKSSVLSLPHSLLQSSIKFHIIMCASFWPKWPATLWRRDCLYPIPLKAWLYIWRRSGTQDCRGSGQNVWYRHEKTN